MQAGGMRSDLPGFEHRVSEPIRVARVLCIFFVIYVHVSPGNSQIDIVGHGLRAFDVFHGMLVNTIGRASVALLSAVSGYLTVHSLARVSFPSVLVRRVRSLLIPMAFWSAAFIGLALVGEHFQAGFIESSLRGPLTVERLPTLLIGVFGEPANLPLYFLRDLFVCVLFAPVLLVLLKRRVALFAAFVAVVYVVGFNSVLFLSPNLFLFFAIGMWIAKSGKVPLSFPAPVIWLSVAGLLIVGGAATAAILSLTMGPDPLSARMVEPLLALVRFPAAILFWAASLWLAARPLGARLARIEPYIFFVFCAHTILMFPVWYAWRSVFGEYYSPLYPIYFVFVPFYVIAASIVIVDIVSMVAPRFLSLVTGGRTLKQGMIIGRNRHPAPKPESKEYSGKLSERRR